MGIKMATKGKNIFAIFQDAKVRGMVVAFVVIVFVITLVSYILYERFAPPKIPNVAAVRGTPALRSVPGVGDSSREYIKLQEAKNVQETEAALQARTAAIPTITRTTYVSNKDVLGDGGKSKVGCGVEDLQRARSAGVTVAELHCRGCSLAALKNAGYTAGELMVAGFTAKELQEAGSTVKELKDAGFSAKDLAAAGYSIADMKNAGFGATELKNAGFTIVDLKKTGFSAAELKAVGFAASDLKTAGYVDDDLVRAGFDKSQIDAANAAKGSETGDCSVASLAKLRAQKITGENLKKISCSATALKTAGFIIAELKNAGFSAKELKDAGYSANELRTVGFALKDLKDADFTTKELKDIDYSANELQKVGFSAGELRHAGFPVKDLKEAGFPAKDLKNAGFAAVELKDAGYLVDEMKGAGYTDGDLVRAGFDKAQLAGEVAEGVTTLACSLENLTKLHVQKIFGPALKKMGCSAAALKAAGFTAPELKMADFRVAELQAAGYTDEDLLHAGFDKNQQAVKSVVAGNETGACSAENLNKLYTQKVTGQVLKTIGCSPAALKAVGYSAADLKVAGFSTKDVKDAGYLDDEASKAVTTGGAISADGIGASASTRNVIGSEVSLVSAPNVLDAGSSWQQRLAELRKQNEQQMSNQDYENQIRQEQQTMSGQASELFSSWVPIQAQQYTAGEGDSNVGGAPGFSGQQGGAASGNVDVYKAGTILFAVLDTGINSDEQSPILATVVQGKLAGAKLLGNFQRVEKKVILQFGVLNVPHVSTSIGINAVAIDPDTAHTVLATNVDSHYLLRFGSMFASSFISGLGQAIQTSGSATTTTIGTGGVSQQNTFPQLNTTQKALVALGNVGQQIGNMLSPIFNTPPTVEVKSGTSMGILIMSDLSVEKVRE